MRAFQSISRIYQVKGNLGNLSCINLPSVNKFDLFNSSARDLEKKFVGLKIPNVAPYPLYRWTGNQSLYATVEKVICSWARQKSSIFVLGVQGILLTTHVEGSIICLECRRIGNH